MGPSGTVASDLSAAGRFVISLDFELHWGVRDHESVTSYQRRLLGARQVVPRLLELFARHEISATWATVGFLMAHDRDELLHHVPTLRPSYADHRLDPYLELDSIGNSERDDPFHYAPSLVRLIASTPGQEVATHTFSHFYPLEAGASKDAFAADLDAAIGLGETHGLTLTSIVFPRNQVTTDALAMCRDRGLTAFRGPETAWYQRPRAGTPPPQARALRLLDAYVPLGTNHLQPTRLVEGLWNVPQSRFLRSTRTRRMVLGGLRLARIETAMSSAAKTGKVFHLWWHPHGFGVCPEENLSFLERILRHYERLRDAWAFQSMTMRDIAAERRVALRTDTVGGSDPRA